MEKQLETEMRELSFGGEITYKLLHSAAQIWNEYLEHPFVKGIADGTLSLSKFKFYMLQDYLYLYDYARVFSLGAAKAYGEESMRYFSRAVTAILDGEMEIHRTYMKKLGIEEKEAEGTKPSLDTLAYTSYMMRVAYEKDALAAAVSILACALSYEWIANKITEWNPGAKDHPFFGEWIRGYSSAEYTDGNRALILLTEALAKNCSKERMSGLSEIFLNCSRFEKRFWDMAWSEMK